jgi:hypothetical protein
MSWVPVQVEFLRREQGGRTAPPRGARYACTAVVDSKEWSIVVDLASTPQRLRFLVDAAPAELLRPGLKLVLLEGSRAVGTAVVEPLDTYRSAPSRLATTELPPPPPGRRSLEPEFRFLGAPG